MRNVHEALTRTMFDYLTHTDWPLDILTPSLYCLLLPMLPMLPIEASWGEIPDSTLMMIGDQTVPHILWRNAFFKAVGEAQPSNTLLSKAHAMAAKKGTKIDKNKLKKTLKKTGKSRKSILGNKKEKATLKENVKKGDGKAETTARRRRTSVLKKSGNKKVKESGATPGNVGVGKKGRKGRGRKTLNADKIKSVKKDEL